jgi:hypothetical protein
VRKGCNTGVLWPDFSGLFLLKGAVLIMPEIIREWVGYNGKMTEEKKPDGTTKKTKHHKIWAVALTDTGHVYVRYGPAKHPLKLTEQIIRPKQGISEGEALGEAERIFHVKVQEKRDQKGYDAITFGVPPHYVPSFSTWHMSDEPEEVVIPVYEIGTRPRSVCSEPLRNVLEDLSELQHLCRWCKTLHLRYLVDIGDGQAYTPEQIISLLSRTAQGTTWLAVSCLRRDDALLNAETQELFAMIIDLAGEGVSECIFKEGLAEGEKGGKPA